jgi:hypothetical protein
VISDLLLWALLLGSTSAGITTAVRALPPVQRWMFERRKPWACDVCMSFWVTGVLALGLGWHDSVLALSAGPAYPWALWVLGKLGEPRTGPPMPPLEEG